MTIFTLDPRLHADTFPVVRLGLCQLLLMNDQRWPWLILVPQRAAITELHELTPLDQTMLTFETGLVAQTLKTVTSCHKLNIGALGNIVQQFHMHLIARNVGDPSWPGPVWGHGTKTPYTEAAAAELIAAIKQNLQSE